jgi:hypothetical protein
MSATITEKIITDIPIITTGDCLRKQIILLTAILSKKNNKLMILYYVIVITKSSANVAGATDGACYRKFGLKNVV